MKITKTNKTVDSFSIEKISNSLNPIFNNLKVKKEDLLKDLESITISKENIDSFDIYELLINTSLKKCVFTGENFDDLDWRFVASRLKTKKLYKEISLNRKLSKLKPYNDFENFYENIKFLVSKNIYSDKILNIYTKEQLQQAYEIINPDFDYQYDFAGINIMYNSYLSSIEKKLYELPQEAYLLIALYLCTVYRKNNQPDFEKIAEIYEAIASLKISLATPILLNMRKASGGYTSCIITSISDDTNSIFYALEQMAKLSSDGSGIGVNLSRIRSKGSWVRGEKGASNGVINYIKLINDIAVTFDQSGKRAGSITVALDTWHLDIFEFLELQTENGDLRRKAFDIFPQMVVSDLFMNRVEKDLNWTLVDPFEVREKYGIELAELYGKEFEDVYQKIEQDESILLKKIVSAKSIFVKFLKVVIETGLPYLTYKDTVNEVNPNKHAGMIGNMNLCCESISNFKPTKVNRKQSFSNGETVYQEVIEKGYAHTCNLVSLNLSLLLDLENVGKYTEIATDIENRIIDLCNLPVEEAQRHNDEYRVIGIGLMGLADHLVYNKMVYTKSRQYVENLMETIQYHALNKSNLMTIEQNKKYAFFHGSEYSKGIICGKDKQWFENNNTYYGKDKWLELINRIQKTGLLNGSLNNIPPNTRTSLVCGTTSSFLPTFSKFFIDKNNNASVPIAPKYLSQNTFWYYQENKNMNQNDVVNIASGLQKWIDQGISMELFIDTNKMNAKDLYGLYMNSWKSKTKAVYYVRQIKKKKSDKECVSCAN